jgi:hypothetical protein
MPELNPKHVQMVIDIINRGPCFWHLSMPVKELGKGYSLVELGIGNEHLNPFADFTVESTLRRSIRPPIGQCIASWMKRSDASRLISRLITLPRRIRAN